MAVQATVREGFELASAALFAIDAGGMITDYKIRQPDPKRASVIAFHSLKYRTIATGDSYNDTTMLAEADAGILFRPPQNVIDEFPQFPVAREYAELQAEFAALQCSYTSPPISSLSCAHHEGVTCKNAWSIGRSRGTLRPHHPFPKFKCETTQQITASTSG